MRIVTRSAVVLSGLALAVLLPATASAQPNLDALAGPLLDSPCKLAQIEATLQHNPMKNPLAPEVSGQIAGAKRENPGGYQQVQRIYDDPAQRRSQFAAYKSRLESQNKKPDAAKTAKYQQLATDLANNCQRY